MVVDIVQGSFTRVRPSHIFFGINIRTNFEIPKYIHDIASKIQAM